MYLELLRWHQQTGKQIHAYFHSFSATGIFSLRIRAFGFFLCSITRCCFPWKTPQYLHSTFWAWECLLFFQAMLNPLWLGCSNTWSHHEKMIILSSSPASPRHLISLRAHIKGGKSSSAVLSERYCTEAAQPACVQWQELPAHLKHTSNSANTKRNTNRICYTNLPATCNEAS